MKLGFLHCPTPRLGTKKALVFANSHIGLFLYLSQVCVCFHWLFLLLRLCLVIPIRPNMVSITLLFFSY